MASELRVDRIIPVNGVPTGGGGGIVQVVNHKTTTRFNASIAHSNSSSITATSGSEYTTFNFTPLRSDSKLLLTSSTFLVGETGNHSDAIVVFATMVEIQYLEVYLIILGIHIGVVTMILLLFLLIICLILGEQHKKQYQ